MIMQIGGKGALEKSCNTEAGFPACWTLVTTLLDGSPSWSLLVPFVLPLNTSIFFFKTGKVLQLFPQNPVVMRGNKHQTTLAPWPPKRTPPWCFFLREDF